MENLPLRVGLFSSPKRTSMPYCGLPSTTQSRVRVLMSMQITRPVIQRGSSGPGLLAPIGTPASQPLPVPPDGVGFGVVLVGEGLVAVGFGVVAVDVGACVAVGVPPVAVAEPGSEPVGVVEPVVGAVFAPPVIGDPAAACSAPTLSAPCDAQPAAPIAIAPTASSSAPPLPTPDVLMPFLTPERGRSLLSLPGCYTPPAQLLEITSNNGSANH